jgi:hypothetical protein
VTLKLVNHPLGQPRIRIIMPTDLGVASERERNATQAQRQTEMTVLLVYLIVSLVMIMLLDADQSFSKAAIELVWRLSP